MSATSASAMSGAATAVGGASGSGVASSQSGPPYLCPTCGTNYSRLEYLRRHERRHADIRPFVCDCGKGFSRSDVLSRHKRQCAVVLNGGEEGGVSGDMSLASNKSANGKRASTGGAGSGARRKNSGAGRNSVGGGRDSRKGGRSDALNDTPDDDDDDDDGEDGAGGASYPAHRHHRNSNADQRSAPFIRPGATTHLQQPPPVASTGSFPFPPQPGVHQSQGGGPAPPPLLPPAPYGSDAGLLGNPGPGGPSNNAPFGNVLPHHMTAFNSMVNQQHNYPSSPESNGTMSQHGSPRFGARDMARHGSNGSRTFSLRKGGSFDHIGPRSASNAMSGTTPNQYAPEFWDALDPAAKTVTSMAGSDYMSAGAAMGMGDPSNGGSGLSGGGLGGGLNGVTTPRGEPQRFAVSTGPLSPFSSIALTSTMSPYLSAFSNARDTPFVASPSRGLIPGTPGSSLNVFDWTMRPPSKPASSSMAKRDSLSQQGPNNGSTSAGVNGTQSGSSTTSPTGNKRKREEDDDSRKSPRIEEIGDVLDDEHRSAAELLDSLRNSGTRQPQTPGATDASTISTSAASIPASVSAADMAADALAAVSAAADVATISAISQGITLPRNDAPSEFSVAGKTMNSVSFFDHGNVTSAPSKEVSGSKDKTEGHHTSSNGGHGRSTSAPDNLTDKPLPRSDSPPRHNLTLSQLPASQPPASAANLAQSSWEAIMQSNDRWGGDGVGHGDGVDPSGPSATDAPSSAKLTSAQQQHVPVVGEEN